MFCVEYLRLACRFDCLIAFSFNKSPNKIKQNKRTNIRGRKRSTGKNAKKASGAVTRVNAPLSKGTLMAQKNPNFHSKGDSVVVKHREMISAVNSTAAYNAAQVFSVNPGLAATFPWLSAIASRYESYRFKKFKVEYEPQVPTTTAGYMGLVVDFDAGDAAPASLINAMQYSGSVSGPTWTRLSMDVKQINLGKFAKDRYIRAGAVAANFDVKTYDLGKIYVISGNAPAAAAGVLYLDYEVELITPQVDSGF